MDIILKLLEKNARISLEELAAACNITAEQAAAQLDGYKENKIIGGFHTIIDWEKAGSDYVTALIELRVSPQKNSGFDALAEEVVRFPEVDSVYLMSGGYDLAVIIHAKNFKEIAFFVSERLAPIDNVLSTATHFILRRYKDWGVTLMDTEKDERRELGL